MQRSIVFYSIGILVFRVLDLISTHYALLGQDHLTNEMNLLVQLLKVDSKTIFYFFELCLAFVLVIWYLFSEKHRQWIYIQTSSRWEYFKTIFFQYGFSKKTFGSWLVFIGLLLPKFIILSSTLYILNNSVVAMMHPFNFWYRLYVGIEQAIGFNVIIYGIPVLLFILLFVQQVGQASKNRF